MPRLQNALSPNMFKECSGLAGIPWVSVICHLPTNSRSQALPSITQEGLLLWNEQHIPIQRPSVAVSSGKPKSFHIAKSLKPEQTGLSQGPEMKGWQHPTWDDLSQWHPGPHVAWLLRTQFLRLPHAVSKSQPASQGVSSSRSWIPCGQTPKHCFLLMT